MARKPMAGPTHRNAMEHGAGALNIDACRIDSGGQEQHRTAAPGMFGGHGIYGAAKEIKNSRQQARADSGLNPRYDTSGRWPPNVLLDPDAAAMLDQMSGERRTSGQQTNGARRGDGMFGQIPDGHHYGDTGGASRFFPVLPVDDPDTLRFMYCPKASRKERGPGNTHPTVKPIALMQWLVRLVAEPGAIILDPFAGSGTTALACIREGVQCILIERDPEYLDIIARRIDAELTRAST
jgi:hypothetical protein